MASQPEGGPRVGVGMRLAAGDPPAHEGEDLTLALAAVEAVAELIDVTGEVLGTDAVERPAQPPHARSEAVLESPRDRDVVEILQITGREDVTSI